VTVVVVLVLVQEEVVGGGGGEWWRRRWWHCKTEGRKVSFLRFSISRLKEKLVDVLSMPFLYFTGQKATVDFKKSVTVCIDGGNGV